MPAATVIGYMLAAGPEARCVASPPFDAMYRIVAHKCPGAERRISSGFRVGKGIVTTLHGVLGCTGEIFAERPQCVIGNATEIVVVPARVAPEADLVELVPRGGQLHGASLTFASAKPPEDHLFKLCGYPAWNSAAPTCSGNPMMASKGSYDNTLHSLLVDGRYAPAKLALETFGLPSLTQLVLHYDTKGGDGFSGGPLVLIPGEPSVIAVHDGRFAPGTEVASHWAIPVFAPLSPVWKPWSKGSAPGVSGEGELKAKGSQTPPATLHFALPPPSLAQPPPPEEVRQFWEHVFSSMLATYPCEWMRMGSEVLNGLCKTPLDVCTNTDAGRVCDRNCVDRVYALPLSELEPAASLLCTQFAQTSGTTPAALGCSKPGDYAWYRANAGYRFGRIFLDTPMQAALMREFYFAGVPYERRNELIEQRVQSWAVDAKARRGLWRLDAAQALFERWRDEQRSRAAVFDASGDPFFVDPTREWKELVPELLLFVVRYLAEGKRTLLPSCSNAHMRFGGEGWIYEIDGGCPESSGGRCLGFNGGDVRARLEAREISAALLAGVLIEAAPVYFAASDGGTATRILTLEVVPQVERVEVKRLSCDADRASEAGRLLVDCKRPGSSVSWPCQAEVEISEACPSIDVRFLVKGRLARRLLLAPN